MTRLLIGQFIFFGTTLSAAFKDRAVAGDANTGDHFGVSSSINQNFLAIGANSADIGELSNAGAVYIYGIESNHTLLFIDKIIATDSSVDDNFGWSLAMSENLLIVGANLADIGELSNAGATYVYAFESNGTTSFLSKLNSPDRAINDNFGYAVSTYGDYLAVGAYLADLNESPDAGAVYLYNAEENGSISYLSKLVAPDLNGGDQFGCSLALQGNLLAIGAKYANPEGVSAAGAVYIFELDTNGSAVFRSKIFAPDKQVGDRFGVSVALENDLLIVGSELADFPEANDAGAAYIFELESNGSATFKTKLVSPDKNESDYFGFSISVSNNLATVGSAFADPNGISNAGAAYLYRIDSNKSATFLSKLSSNDEDFDDKFGMSVSSFGSSVVVGSNLANLGELDDAGAAYIFDIGPIANRPPTGLNSNEIFLINENQPIRSVVGNLVATDLDADSFLIYNLIEGEGDVDNGLFTLDINGTLRSDVTFDYESNASQYSIRVQAKDQYEASTDAILSVLLGDIENVEVLIEQAGQGTILGSRIYDLGEVISLTANPSQGYLFSGWTGDLNSTEFNIQWIADGNRSLVATFPEDFSDNDEDGLSNYFELVVFGSNPDLPDSDGDGFSDSEENQTGLDPNVSDANYRAYYVQEIGNAQTAGNNGGIAWITENRSNYDLNTSAEVQYELGYQQGYSDTLIWLKENNASLYYESEINSFSEQAAIDQTNQVKEQLSVGVSGLAHIQQYRDENPPHAENWYYQPGMGWLWTNRSIFPVVYFADPDESVGGRWIYSIKSEDLEDGSYYDFLTNGIIDSSYHSNQ